MSMTKISAVTVAKAAAKSKFLSSGEEGAVTHSEIVETFNEDQANKAVHHDERNDTSLSVLPSDFDISNLEVNTYIPEFPIDLVEMIDQPRKKIVTQTCLDLANSVNTYSENGNPLYEQPVTAWYCSVRKKMVVKNGHRRTTGAKKANWKTINLIVVGKQEDLDRSFDQVIDNIHVESMDPFDVAFTFKKWADRGYSYSQISERLSISDNVTSKTTVANYVTLAKMPQELIDFGMLYLSHDVGAYLELNKLYKLNEAAAKELMNKCKADGVFTRKIAKDAYLKVKESITKKEKLPNESSDMSYKLKEVTVSKLGSTIGQIAKKGHKDVSVVLRGGDGIEKSLTMLTVDLDGDTPKVVISVD